MLTDGLPAARGRNHGAPIVRNCTPGITRFAARELPGPPDRRFLIARTPCSAMSNHFCCLPRNWPAALCFHRDLLLSHCRSDSSDISCAIPNTAFRSCLPIPCPWADEQRSHRIRCRLRVFNAIQTCTLRPCRARLRPGTSIPFLIIGCPLQIARRTAAALWPMAVRLTVMAVRVLRRWASPRATFRRQRGSGIS